LGSRGQQERPAGRVDYYHDPDAPRANSLVVGTSVVVHDQHGRILLQRRSDSGQWALPGGAMDIGETISQAAIREAREETGVEVEIERLVGIYSDPGHVFAYHDGEVRQQFNVCFAGRPAGGELAVSPESTEVAFFTLEQLADLDVHESIRVRIRDYLHRTEPAIR
jgi:ADP-ribose pyrophosphatase YjhB (NUDIX family)